MNKYIIQDILYHLERASALHNLTIKKKKYFDFTSKEVKKIQKYYNIDNGKLEIPTLKDKLTIKKK